MMLSLLALVSIACLPHVSAMCTDFHDLNEYSFRELQREVREAGHPANGHKSQIIRYVLDNGVDIPLYTRARGTNLIDTSGARAEARARRSSSVLPRGIDTAPPAAVSWGVAPALMDSCFTAFLPETVCYK